MTQPDPNHDHSLFDEVLGAIQPVATTMNSALEGVWRSVEVWDLTQRLFLYEVVLPPDARAELRRLLAVSGQLEEDLHRLEAAYQLLVEYVAAAEAARGIERGAGR